VDRGIGRRRVAVTDDVAYVVVESDQRLELDAYDLSTGQRQFSKPLGPGRCMAVIPLPGRVAVHVSSPSEARLVTFET
jgi:hypothetical protein